MGRHFSWLFMAWIHTYPLVALEVMAASDYWWEIGE